MPCLARVENRTGYQLQWSEKPPNRHQSDDQRFSCVGLVKSYRARRPAVPLEEYLASMSSCKAWCRPASQANPPRSSQNPYYENTLNDKGWFAVNMKRLHGWDRWCREIVCAMWNRGLHTPQLTKWQAFADIEQDLSANSVDFGGIAMNIEKSTVQPFRSLILSFR